MNTKVKKIKYALEHNPLLIPSLMKDTSIPKGMLFGILQRALPCRIGIEFELAGAFGLNFLKEHPDMIFEKGDIDKMLTSWYNVTEIKGDTSMEEITPEQRANQSIPLQEIRISISNFRQLAGLYKFMQDLPKYCAIHSNGGIHVHIDMTQYKLFDTFKEQEVKNYITNRLDEVAKLFPKYRGRHNNKEVGIRHKGTWVNISRLNTLEFRIMPLTFDYSELIKWIFGIVKFRQNLIHCCKLKPNYTPKNSSPSRPKRLNVDAEDELARHAIATSSTSTTTFPTYTVYTTGPCRSSSSS